MNHTVIEIKEKIRQQFEFGPYPRTPIDKSPKEDANALFTHNLVTPYYLRNQQVISTAGKTILDAGCGSGYKSLILAEANPGAEIVGIDLSEKSVELAQQRLEYHGFENAQFQVLGIEELPSLGLQFDYINCDEVLYLFPDPAVGLQAMKSVLKPEGIIRANLHSSLQRAVYFRAQKVFRAMDLMGNNPEDLEIGLVQEIMQSLKDGVDLKIRTWKPYLEREDAQESILMNFLFQGDRGYDIPDLFRAIRGAELEFVSMVNWRQWELLDLFKDPDDLPFFLALSLPEITAEERLHLFECLHPIHRLLDFWCAHPGQGNLVAPISAWKAADWARVQVHLHPQLRTTKVKEGLIKTLRDQNPLDLTTYLKAPAQGSVLVDTQAVACLLALQDGPQPLLGLAERWLQLRPRDPVTLEPVTAEAALAELQKLLTRLEIFLYVLLEIA